MKARYMPVIEMLTEIHNILMTRIHQKRDWIKHNFFVVIPKIKQILEDALEESAGYTVLWMGMKIMLTRAMGVCQSKK